MRSNLVNVNTEVRFVVLRAVDILECEAVYFNLQVSTFQRKLHAIVFKV